MNVKGIIVVISVLAFFLYYQCYATELVLTDIYDSPDPVNVINASITISVVVNRVDASEDAVILQILSPEEVNVTPYKSEFLDSQRNKYYFRFDPSISSLYTYRIWANNTNGEITISEQYTFESSYFPYLAGIEYNDKTKWDNGTINFNVTVQKWIENVTDVIVEVYYPEHNNVSLIKYYEEGNISKWYGSYDPNTTSLLLYDVFDPIYNFRIYLKDNSSFFTVHDGYNFIAEGYYPQIKNIKLSGNVTIGSNITINVYVDDKTNASNSSSNINYSYVFLIQPDLSYVTFPLIRINESYYAANYTLHYDGDYYFKVYFYDDEGNKVVSGYNGFSTHGNVFESVNITVRVAPSCQARIWLLPDEDKILVNQTVIWLSIFENFGNVPLNETTNISVRKDVINPGEEKWVKLPPNIFAYAIDKEEEVPFLDDSFFFLIWFTHGLPLGNYTAETWSTYWANVSLEDNEYFYCNGTVNDTVHFELVEAIGETRPSPFLVIREMPEQIYQTDQCLLSNSSFDSCISTKVRMILFNRGSSLAYDIYVKEKIIQSFCNATSSDFCKIGGIRCINSSDYTCTITTNESLGELGSLEFNITKPIAPREYVILEYELIPSPYLFVYDNKTAYGFELRGTHKYGEDTKTYIIQENDGKVNIPESKIMVLKPLPSFNYDIIVSSANSTEERRTFKAGTLETFIVKAPFVSTISTTSWEINLTLPSYFNVVSCSHVAGPLCSCNVYSNHTNTTFSPYPVIVSCKGLEAVNEGNEVVFSFDANVSTYGDFLIPVMANDTIPMDERYLPGLFLLSTTRQIIETPKPQPEPTPQPQPVPQPTPQPQQGPELQQEHSPKIEIVIRPLNESYVVYQGDTFPTYFEIENIGNATAENITLEAILPSALWSQSKNWIDVLNPGEKVNRTLMLSVSENLVPGTYILPVKAMVGDKIGDITYIKVIVKFGKNLAKLKIVESAVEIEIEEGEEIIMPVLLKNVGKKILHNVSIRLENIDECLRYYNSTKHEIKVNESTTINVYLKAKEVKNKVCKSLLIAYSDEGAYDFTPLIIKVYPKPAMLPLRGYLTPFISLLWTLIFIIYAVIRKRKAMHGEVARTKVPRMILYLLMTGELIIIVYVTLWILGIVGGF